MGLQRVQVSAIHLPHDTEVDSPNLKNSVLKDWTVTSPEMKKG